MQKKGTYTTADYDKRGTCTLFLLVNPWRGYQVLWEIHQNEKKRRKGKAGTISEGVAFFLPPGDEKKKGCNSSKEKTGTGDCEQTVRPKPKPQGGNEFYISAADTAFGDDGKEQKNEASAD